VTYSPGLAPDRRVQRTRRALRDALHSLIREKPYDSIPVHEILNRADVGRSTFYSHYRDKDELLASSIQDLLDQSRAAAPELTQSHIDRILSFSLPIFEQLERHRREAQRPLQPEARAAFHQHLRRVLGDLIAGGRDAVERGSMVLGKIPSALLIQYLTATFMLVVEWWAVSGSPLAAAEVNQVFRERLSSTALV
jgi:AcrR family transcriptional regulator